MGRRLLAIGLALGAALGGASARAALTTYVTRASWESAASAVGGGTVSENFDAFGADTPYGPGGSGTAPVQAGFVELSLPIQPASVGFLVDYVGDGTAIPEIHSVDGTNFAVAGASGSAYTITMFAPAVALGFDFGPVDMALDGPVQMETSRGDQVSFMNSSTGGFFGLVYDGTDAEGNPETIDSLRWVSSFAGIDNVEAFSPPAAVPLPGGLWLLGAAVTLAGWLRRTR